MSATIFKVEGSGAVPLDAPHLILCVLYLRYTFPKDTVERFTRDVTKTIGKYRVAYVKSVRIGDHYHLAAILEDYSVMVFTDLPDEFMLEGRDNNRYSASVVERLDVTVNAIRYVMERKRL
jgi:hypothetical protein